MPEIGTRDVKSFKLYGPSIAEESLREGSLTLTDAEILQLTVEIDDRPVVEMLPPALHPSLPAIATFVIWRCGASEVGPFSLAQVRVGCRAGIRSRALLCASYCDSPEAAKWLRERRGFDCQLGKVDLRHRYDRVEGDVEFDGRSILRIALVKPEVIGVDAIELTDNLNPARVCANGEAHLRLVQLEPEYLLRKADRGTPVVEFFDPVAWSAEHLLPSAPIVALACHGELRLPPVRYLVNPA